MTSTHVAAVAAMVITFTTLIPSHAACADAEKLPGASLADPVFDDPDAVRGRVEAWLRGISDGAFEPTPGEHCRWCDFRAFCDAGTRWLEGRR